METATLTRKDVLFMIASSFKKVEGATHANVTITPTKIHIEYMSVEKFNVELVKGGMNALLGAKYTSLKELSLKVGMRSIIKSDAIVSYTETDNEGNVEDTYHPSALFSFAKKAYTCHTCDNTLHDKEVKTFFGI